MELEHFRLDVADYVATITFDRPPVNAQNRATRDELTRIVDTIGDRDDVRVAILTGTGDIFSAGADVKERVGMVRQPGDYVRHNRVVREFFYSVSDCACPVIAAVNGPALGAGFALMLACDIMLASENAYVSMPEVDVGLAGGASFLMRHLGKSQARTMYFTAARVPAAELYRLGIIQACPPRDRLMEEAMKIALTIAEKSPHVIRQVKRAFNVVEEMPARDAYRYEQTVTVDLSHSKDAKEAQRAFVEKRKPVFKGR